MKNTKNKNKKPINWGMIYWGLFVLILLVSVVNFLLWEVTNNKVFLILPLIWILAFVFVLGYNGIKAIIGGFQGDK